LANNAKACLAGGDPEPNGVSARLGEQLGHETAELGYRMAIPTVQQLSLGETAEEATASQLTESAA